MTGEQLKSKQYGSSEGKEQVKAGPEQEGFYIKPGLNGGSVGAAPFVKQDADTSTAEDGS